MKIIILIFIFEIKFYSEFINKYNPCRNYTTNTFKYIIN